MNIGETMHSKYMLWGRGGGWEERERYFCMKIQIRMLKSVFRKPVEPITKNRIAALLNITYLEESA